LSEQSRPLPGRPNRRYLKIEAKRRLSAGEFSTLHEAQLAIAREHGLTSWTALIQAVDAARSPENPALVQVAWVLARFADAGTAAWSAPDGEELREHFDEHFLSLVPPETLVGTIARVAPRLRAGLVVTRAAPLRLRAQVAGLQIEAAAEPEPPHRLTGLRMYPLGQAVADPRVATPPSRSFGQVPGLAQEVAQESFAQLGLVGLVLAGTAASSVWTLARGWADVDRDEALRPDHQFPAYAITKLITSTVVLRLVAESRMGLDDPANSHLRTIRLADDTVTVRELLIHTGGVNSPDTMFADRVPDVLSLLGPVARCDGPRGTFAHSNGGYAILGQLIADVAGAAYADVATRMVLEPLGMNSSWFPTRWPDTDTPARMSPDSSAVVTLGTITGYRLAADGMFQPVPAQVFTALAAGGLWTTAADLVRFGLTWSTLLPVDLAREAQRPQAERGAPGAQIGLGWMLNLPKGVCGHPGGGPSAASSLIIRLSTGQPTVAWTNRLVPVEPVNGRLIGPIA
jgi:CubicO group peptidase (beta-lactamase class C family)